jgi:spermidine synthase
MVPWRELGRATVGGQTLVLAQRGDEFAIRVRGAELMNSRSHASEETLARLGCAPFARTPNARVLVGGLGMSFTLRAALDSLRADAQVTVGELVPEIVAWNREHLGHLARQPLGDPRVRIQMGDVTRTIAAASQPWHVILLDVDNGPDAFTTPANAGLYGLKGLIAIRRALVPGGTLAVWSVEKDAKFTDRLRGAGFAVDRQFVPARPNSKVEHVIWIATAPGDGDDAAPGPARPDRKPSSRGPSPTGRPRNSHRRR